MGRAAPVFASAECGDDLVAKRPVDHAGQRPASRPGPTGCAAMRRPGPPGRGRTRRSRCIASHAATLSGRIAPRHAGRHDALAPCMAGQQHGLALPARRDVGRVPHRCRPRPCRQTVAKCDISARRPRTTRWPCGSNHPRSPVRNQPSSNAVWGQVVAPEISRGHDRPAHDDLSADRTRIQGRRLTGGADRDLAPVQRPQARRASGAEQATQNVVSVATVNRGTSGGRLTWCSWSASLRTGCPRRSGGSGCLPAGWPRRPASRRVDLLRHGRSWPRAAAHAPNSRPGRRSRRRRRPGPGRCRASATPAAVANVEAVSTTSAGDNPCTPRKPRLRHGEQVACGQQRRLWAARRTRRVQDQAGQVDAASRDARSRSLAEASEPGVQVGTDQQLGPAMLEQGATRTTCEPRGRGAAAARPAPRRPPASA